MINILISTAFLFLSIFAIIYTLKFLKLADNRKHFRKYYVALAGVYFSAIFLVWLLSIIMAELPLLFVLISSISISSIFVFSSYTINQLTVNMDEIRKELQSKKVNKEEINDKKV